MNDQGCEVPRDTQRNMPGQELLNRLGPVAGLNESTQEIRINSVLNGFIVHVGCQRVVFETREKMLQELDRYFKNPGQVQKEYLEQKRQKEA